MAVLLHVEMDAFFASVELLAHPEWRGRPLVVGALPHERGVVSTCSYEARRYGIHSAMPSRTAYQCCPHAVFTRPDMERYEEVSARAFEVFARYTPYVEGVSIDEAFLDITGSVHLYGSAERLGEELRSEIKRECGVTCSVGIAPNRLLAKIGSEENKPDGLTIMPFSPEEAAAFLAPRPLKILWGVGEKTMRLLKPYGIGTCGDVQRIEYNRLESLLGSSGALSLKNYAMGISDETVYWRDEEEKSLSREFTFEKDETNREAVREKLIEIAAEVGRRFRREKRWAKTARLKLRDGKFNTLTRQLTFDNPVRDDISLRKAALKLFDREWPAHSATPKTVRLIGFGVANFQASPIGDTPSLFADPMDEEREKRERLSDALDALRDRGILR